MEVCSVTDFIYIYLIFIIGFIKDGDANTCGCKSLRACYETMIRDLKYGDEVFCIEQAAMGSSTVEVYLRALSKYCNEIIEVKEVGITAEGRTLFQASIEEPEVENSKGEKVQKPVILIDAGQEGGADSVGLALYFIQQLVACEDYIEMTSKVKWVLLPNSNPDGMEIGRVDPLWRKNMVSIEGELGHGVDISRNFDYKFSSCSAGKVLLAPNYPGKSAASEIETKAISEAIDNNADKAEAYLSIRKDGHAILYPYAFDDVEDDKLSMRAADLIAARVNQRTGSIRVFTNSSIYKENGEKRCGHSVDYAFSKGIKIALELRTFHGAELEITMKYMALPRGYESTLRNGYFIALRELYNVIINNNNDNTP